MGSRGIQSQGLVQLCHLAALNLRIFLVLYLQRESDSLITSDYIHACVMDVSHRVEC